jgi:hypothetical protein
MSKRSGRERAVMLAEMAPHPSVTVGLLADEGGRLAGDPPVTYLDGTEAPAYALTNGKRGIGVGTKRNCTQPDGDRGTVILVTDRRTLCLVGSAEGDESIEIEHDTLADVQYHTGLIANRLVVETPRKRVHCWINRTVDEEMLEAVTAYVEDRLPETPISETAAEQRQYKSTYRGKPIPPPEQQAADEDGGTAADGDGTAAEDDDQPTVTYRGKEVDPSYLR